MKKNVPYLFKYPVHAYLQKIMMFVCDLYRSCLICRAIVW